MFSKSGQRGVLGRGLGSIFPTSSKGESGIESSVFFCKVENIVANDKQPRKIFEEEALEELAQSIHEKGLLQPIVVRPHSDLPGKYEIIAGERRWRAAQRAGLDEIPVMVKNTDEQESLELALIENLQRENLNPLEEARAFQEFVDKYGMTHEALAQKLGKSRSLVANALRLLKLPESVSKLLLDGTLSNGHARALIALEDPVVQGELAKRIVTEGLSVRETEALINSLKAARSIKKKIYKNQNVEPNTRWLEDQFRQIFGTKVKLYERGNKGRLVIEFFSKEELNRLYALVAKSGPVADYIAEEEKVYAV